jgi:hypothetical protein
LCSVNLGYVRFLRPAALRGLRLQCRRLPVSCGQVDRLHYGVRYVRLRLSSVRKVLFERGHQGCTYSYTYEDLEASLRSNRVTHHYGVLTYCVWWIKVLKMTCDTVSIIKVTLSNSTCQFYECFLWRSERRPVDSCKYSIDNKFVTSSIKKMRMFHLKWTDGPVGNSVTHTSRVLSRYQWDSRYLYLLADEHLPTRVPARKCLLFEWFKMFKCDFCLQNRRYLKCDVVDVCGSCHGFVLLFLCVVDMRFL